MRFYQSYWMIFSYLRKSEARNKTGRLQNDATQSHTYYLVSPSLKDLLVSAHLLVILRYLNLKYTIIQVVSYWYNCYTQKHCHTVTVTKWPATHCKISTGIFYFNIPSIPSRVTLKTINQGNLLKNNSSYCTVCVLLWFGLKKKKQTMHLPDLGTRNRRSAWNHTPQGFVSVTP